MVTRSQNSANSVVGLIFVTDMIDDWRAVKSIMSETKTKCHRASAHGCLQTTKWLKTFDAPSRSSWKNPFNSILNMGPRFKYLPKGYYYINSYNFFRNFKISLWFYWSRLTKQFTRRCLFLWSLSEIMKPKISKLENKSTVNDAIRRTQSSVITKNAIV